jgi:hypothetical protein
MASDEEILTIFNMLRANYHYAMKDMAAKQISDLEVLWCELLGDVDGDLLRAAALQHATTSKWFPTVAELRQLAADITLGHKMTAMEAWGEVTRQIRTIGHWDKPEFSDLLVRKLVSDMGWLNLCMSEMPGADRARFMDGYNALLSRERREVLELPLVSKMRRQFQQLVECKRLGVPSRELGT